jgi:hypothetical protein
MRSDTIDVESAELVERLNARPRTRDVPTVSGETRSQLYQRLRSEGSWDVAEAEKELVRKQCRAAGKTKAESGRRAWDAIATAFPPVDASTWHEFDSRSWRPPLVSKLSDLTDETATMAKFWTGSTRLIASLATRCPTIRENSHAVLLAIDARLRLEPADSLVFDSVALAQLDEAAFANPKDVLGHAQELFRDYQSTSTPYSEAVADELRNLLHLMELTPNLIDQQWSRVSRWLWGPDAQKARNHLTRACEERGSVVK